MIGYSFHTTGLPILSIILLCLISAPSANCQDINKRGLGSASASSISGYNPNFTSTLGTFIREDGDQKSYHPLTIRELRLLQENSQPYWGNEEAEKERVERATQKAFAIQSAHHLSFVLKDSELRHVYRDIQDSLKSIRNYFKYSLQSDGSTMKLSRTVEGQKILELNLEFNLKQGVDPQLRIGEYMRLRYDYAYDGTFLEYAVDF